MVHKIKRFVTSYKQGKNKFGSHIYAKSFKEAERIVVERNIGEIVIGISGGTTDGYGRHVPEELENPDFRKINDYQFLNLLPQIIHSANFLGFIAFKSGKIKIEELIGDHGVIHELVHLMESEILNTRQIKRTRGLFYNLQSKVPSNFKSLPK